MHRYTAFANNFNHALATITECKRQPSFTAYLCYCIQEREECSNLSVCLHLSPFLLCKSLRRVDGLQVARGSSHCADPADSSVRLPCCALATACISSSCLGLVLSP